MTENVTTEPQKVNYESVDKASFSQIIATKFPRELIPSKKINTIFVLIIFAVLIYSATQFPLDSLISGNFNIVMSIGFPLHFIELNASGKNSSPASLTNLLIDLSIYLILAYIIDVFLNFIMMKDRGEELEQKPVIFKDQKITIAEKTANKIFGNS